MIPDKCPICDSVEVIPQAGPKGWAPELWMCCDCRAEFTPEGVVMVVEDVHGG